MLILGLAMPLLAAGGWLWWLYLSDRFEREPWGLILKVVAAGGAAGLISVGAAWWMPAPPGGLLARSALQALLHVGLLAGLLGGFPYRDPNWNEPFDGLVYGGAAGIGYGLVVTLPALVGNATAGFRVAVFSMPVYMLIGIIVGHHLSLIRFGPRGLGAAASVGLTVGVASVSAAAAGSDLVVGSAVAAAAAAAADLSGGAPAAVPPATFRRRWTALLTWLRGLAIAFAFLVTIDLALAAGGEVVSGRNMLAGLMAYGANTLAWMAATRAMDLSRSGEVLQPDAPRLALDTATCQSCGDGYPVKAIYCPSCGQSIRRQREA